MRRYLGRKFYSLEIPILILSAYVIFARYFELSLSLERFGLRIEVNPEKDLQIAILIIVALCLFVIVLYGSQFLKLHVSTLNALRFIFCLWISLVAIYSGFLQIFYGIQYSISEYLWFFGLIILSYVIALFGNLFLMSCLALHSLSSDRKRLIPPVTDRSLLRFSLIMMLLLCVAYFYLSSVASGVFDEVKYFTLVLFVSFHLIINFLKTYIIYDDSQNIIPFQKRMRSSAFDHRDYTLFLNKTFSDPSSWHGLYMRAKSINANKIMIKFSADGTSKELEINIKKLTQCYENFLAAKKNERLRFNYAKDFLECIKEKSQNASNPSLHSAAEQGDYLSVKKILNLECNVNQQDVTGWTPLLYAVANNRLEIVKLLLQNAANPNISNLSLISPLHYAARYGYLHTCKLLFEYGANTNARDGYGETSFMIAIRCHHISTAKFLSHITDLTIKNYHSKNALELATEAKNGELCKLIRQKTAV